MDSSSTQNRVSRDYADDSERLTWDGFAPGPSAPSDAAITQETREVVFRNGKALQASGFRHPVCEEPDVPEEQAYMERFLDDVTGRELDPAGAREAAGRGKPNWTSSNRWGLGSRPQVSLGVDAPILAGRWVGVNTGEEEHPQARSRFVAKESERGVASVLVARYFVALPAVE